MKEMIFGTALTLAFTTWAFALDVGQSKSIDTSIFKGSYYKTAGAPTPWLDSQMKLHLIRSIEGHLIITDENGKKESDLPVTNCGWQNQDANPIVKNRYLLVICDSNAPAQDHEIWGGGSTSSIVDLETRSITAIPAIAITGLDSGSSYFFDDENANILEVKYDSNTNDVKKTYLRLIDVLSQKTGPTIALDSLLYVSTTAQSKKSPVYLMYGNGVELASLMLYGSDETSVQITTVDLTNGKVLKSLAGKQTYNSECAEQLGGSPSVVADGNPYFVTNNGAVLGNGCELPGLLQGVTNSYALIDPITLKVYKVLNPKFSATLPAPRLLDQVITVSGKQYLRSTREEVSSSTVQFGTGVDINSGTVVRVPLGQKVITDSNIDLSIAYNSEQCNSGAASQLDYVLADLSNGGKLLNRLSVPIGPFCLGNESRFYTGGYGGTVESRGQLFHIRGPNVNNVNTITLTRLY